MKKSIPILFLLLVAALLPAQTLRTSKVDNFSAADSLKVIMTRGTLGPAGFVLGRATSGDTLAWLPRDAGGATSVDSLTGLGTGVTAALKVNVGTAGAIVVNGGALGTPSSGTLTNATGLPISTGVSGLATGIATWLGTPSSANLRAALTDETGTGLAYFQGGALGTPSSGTLTNATGLPISTGVSGLGTGVATALAVNTGSAGAVVLFNGALGTPSSGTLTNATGLPIATGVSGLGSGVATFLATPSSANLRAALTDETGTGFAVFSQAPTLTRLTTADSIQANWISAGKFSGAVVADSATFSGLNAGYALTVSGTGKLVDNGVIRMGSSALGFFGNTAVTRPSIGTLTAYNPVTQTANFMTQFQALLTALGNATGVGLVQP